MVAAYEARAYVLEANHSLKGVQEQLKDYLQ